MTLTGHKISKDDAKNYTNSVVVVGDQAMFGENRYGYYNESGTLHEFQECKTDGILSSHYTCLDKDGSHTFSYDKIKSNLNEAKITSDGVDLSLDCYSSSMSEPVCIPEKDLV